MANISSDRNNFYDYVTLRTKNPGKFRIVVNMLLTREPDLELNGEQLENLWNSETEEIETAVRRPKLQILSRLVGRKRKNADVSEDSIADGVNALQSVSRLLALLETNERAMYEGIFRKEGSRPREEYLRYVIDEGDLMTLEAAFGENFKVHDAACLLKRVVRDLPEPLIPASHRHVYLAMSAWAEPNKPLPQSIAIRQLRVIRLLMLVLPEHTVKILHRLLCLLKAIANQKKSTKMDEANLALIWTPNLFIPLAVVNSHDIQTNYQSLSRLVALMIDRVDEIFKLPVDVVQDFKLNFRTEAVSNSEEISYDGHNSIDSMTMTRTAISYVDRERSAVDSAIINTETQLAELCAYVQMMPDGPEKSKRMKQFQDYNRKMLRRIKQANPANSSDNSPSAMINDENLDEDEHCAKRQRMLSPNWNGMFLKKHSPSPAQTLQNSGRFLDVPTTPNTTWYMDSPMTSPMSVDNARQPLKQISNGQISNCSMKSVASPASATEASVPTSPFSPIQYRPDDEEMKMDHLQIPTSTTGGKIRRRPTPAPKSQRPQGLTFCDGSMDF